MESAEDVEFEVSWGDHAVIPPQFANQFVTQLGGAAGTSRVPDGIYLLMGVISPPLIVGSTEQVSRQIAEARAGLTIQPLAKFVLSRERAAELRDVLNTSIQQFDAAVAQDQGARVK